MVGGGRAVVNVEPLHEAATEGVNELRIPVSNDAFWELVELPHMINEYLDQSFCCDCGQAWNKMSAFAKPIHHEIDTIMASDGWTREDVTLD
ncbi:uncharacterized protein EMH_0024940 [Eimeria mitis]|uniref:Uncharacterized protein n=1 Tax=Eimeria mitis TaxID=44415 RepID=U6KKJ3_9EIME|nr:uncharacterized protein EMH_0024940 [Eimeria mitis]CDJ36797.1 hypothetical protein EMH_0024940 [Eimeria mitis]